MGERNLYDLNLIYEVCVLFRLAHIKLTFLSVKKTKNDDKETENIKHQVHIEGFTPSTGKRIDKNHGTVISFVKLSLRSTYLFDVTCRFSVPRILITNREELGGGMNKVELDGKNDTIKWICVYFRTKNAQNNCKF